MVFVKMPVMHKLLTHVLTLDILNVKPTMPVSITLVCVLQLHVQQDTSAEEVTQMV